MERVDLGVGAEILRFGVTVGVSIPLPGAVSHFNPKDLGWKDCGRPGSAA